MADKQSRLAEIYKAEKERGGGVLSTLGKRAKEKFDPRQMFNQGGLAAAVLPSVFKSYDAVGKQGKVKQLSEENKQASVSSAALESGLGTLISETRELTIHSKLAAKNSIVLPSMARDMNVMRQNMAKLVKLQGGTATTKADMFFKRAGDREAAYESKFSKAGGTSTTKPTQVGAKPEEKESGGILSFLGTIASYLLKGGLLGLLAIGVSKLLENQDVVDGIKSFVKQVILGIQTIIQKGSGILGDLFSDPDVKEGIVKTFVAVKDLFVKGITALGDLASDPRFAEGVVQIFSAIWEAIKKAFNGLDAYLKNELNVPGGLLTVLAAGGALYLAITTLSGALVGLAAAAGTAAAAWAASKLGLPSIGVPTGGTPPVTGTPNKPPLVGTPGKEIASKVPSGALSEFGTVGKEAAARRAAAELAAKEAAKQSGKKGVMLILEKFFTGEAATLLGGPIGAAWLTAVTAYQVADALAPDEQQQVIDSVAALASIQDDINQGGNEKILKQRAVLYQEKLKRLGVAPQKLESAKVQALPSAPNESSAEATRLAAAGKPTPVATSTPAAPSTKPTAAPTQTNSSDDTKSSRQQIEAYLGKAISDQEYDALLRATGAEAASSPMERAAVASVILNRAKKAGGNILGVLNAPFQFQAITGPDGKSGTTDNPWSSNAKKVIPGIDKQIADNIALVPKGLDSFTSAVPGAYKDVGGQEKFDKKMAEMQAHGGQQIGQTVFASMGGTPSVGTPSAPGITPPPTTVAAATKPDFGSMIASATSELGDTLSTFNNAMHSITNVTNNNTQVAAPQPASRGNLPSVYDDIFLNLFQRVT